MNLMTLHLENMITMLLFFAGIIIVIYAQSKINNSYRKSSKIKIKSGLSGVEVARKILDSNNLSNIHVVSVGGTLTDHYDPSRKVVRLSNDVFNNDSIAAISVAAHECGHAIQDKVGYTFMKIRAALVPIVNFVTYIGYIVSIISLFAGITGYLKVGIMLIIVSLIFQLVTLPVEFDASKRAIEELNKLGLIEKEENQNVKEMLSAAAFTYVASFISSILNLLRLVIMLGNRDE